MERVSQAGCDVSIRVLSFKLVVVWGSLRSGSGLLGTKHNRKGGAFEIEQPKVGPKGETSGSERVKGHGEHGVEEELGIFLGAATKEVVVESFV